MSRDQDLIAKASQAGQGHIFRFWEELSDQQRRRLLSQVRKIDFELIAKLAEQLLRSPHKALVGEIEPVEIIPIPRNEEQLKRAEEAKRVGEKALREGKVACLLVAGGQATRLDFQGPKGKFPIGPISNKSLFQLHAEKILAISRRYGSTIPWYIMTSETNHEETVEFFKENNYFGLKGDDVFFFRQRMIPALDENGKLILDAKDHIFTSPNGHGGVLSALKESGALEDMKRRGIQEVFYFQVDNVLIKICDPVFIGYHLLEGAEMSSKAVAKRDPWEKIGILGRINGRLGVIEYSDLPRELMEARNPDGSLKYWAGNLAIHMFKVSFLERDFNLPYHIAHKKIPYLDDRGQLVKPDEPNGYKFETFVFDALRYAERSVTMEVKREEEFSAVKNREGQDSPLTAQRDMINFFGRWLEKAGIRVPRDGEGNVQGKIEISPLFALDEEEFLRKVDRRMGFDGYLYLS